MERICLSGAGGYIGSHTAFWLLKMRDCEITILDNLSTGFVENIEFLKSRFGERIHFVKLDLCDKDALAEAFKAGRFDSVVHFAASIIVPESTRLPLLYYANNTRNTLNLITQCVESGVKEFIFSSTAAVYGEPQIVPVSEDSALAPINPYGNSKMMSEMILRDASKAHDFNFVALRYFNVAGALGENDYAAKCGLGQRSKNATHLIKVACECACGKRDGMSVFGDDYDTRDGTCVRDYIHIDDLALAHLSALDFLRTAQRSEVFNVGYGRGYSVKEVVDMVKRVSGVEFKVRNVPRRAGDPANLISNNTKILQKSAWKPRFDDLEFIVKSAYEWERMI